MYIGIVLKKLHCYNSSIFKTLSIVFYLNNIVLIGAIPHHKKRNSITVLI